MVADPGSNRASSNSISIYCLGSGLPRIFSSSNSVDRGNPARLDIVDSRLHLHELEKPADFRNPFGSRLFCFCFASIRDRLPFYARLVGGKSNVGLLLVVWE